MKLLSLLQVVAISLLCSKSALAIAPVVVPVGEILRSGLCVQHDGKNYAQPQSTAGYASTGPLTLTENTTEVPLRKGIGFGFTWKAKNLPERPTVTYRVEHPTITRPDGVTLNHFEEELEESAPNGLIETIDCYMLSEDHELVPGEWTLSVFFRGSLLVKKSFHIYAPNP